VIEYLRGSEASDSDYDMIAGGKGNAPIPASKSCSIRFMPATIPNLLNGNSLYTLLAPSGDYYAREREANRLGGNQLIISSQQEQDFIFSKYGDLTEGIALGISDLETEGVWKNSDNTLANYTNWQRGEPNNYSRAEHVGIMITRTYFYPWEYGWSRGKWQDMGNGVSSSYEYTSEGKYKGITLAEIPVKISTYESTSAAEGGICQTIFAFQAGNVTDLLNGTKIYWKASGIDLQDLTAGSLTGSEIINDGKIGIQHSLKIDSDIGEQFQIAIFSDPQMSQQIGATYSTTVQEAPSPKYNILTSAAEVKEGLSLTAQINTSNVLSGSQIFYTLSGGGINSNDFSSGSLAGSGSIGPDGKFSFSHTFANDLTTEGAENLEIKLFTDSAWTNQVASTTVVIQDTSITPIPTYSFNTSSSSVREGDSFSSTVSTSNLPAGTTVYYSLKGAGITAADFSSGSLAGSGSIGPDGRFSFSHTLASDLTTEGIEDLEIKLFTDSARTNQVATTTIAIQDTSTKPQPVYGLSTSRSIVNEGDFVATTVSTTGIEDGTNLYFIVSGTGISENDFARVEINPRIVIAPARVGYVPPKENPIKDYGTVMSGKLFIRHFVENDYKTEGTENLEIKLFTDSARTNQVATTTVAIQDTSTTPIPTYSINTSSSSVREGESFSTSPSQARV